MHTTPAVLAFIVAFTIGDAFVFLLRKFDYSPSDIWGYLLTAIVFVCYYFWLRPEK